MPSLTLAAWFHDLDPIIVEFNTFFALRWYGLSYLAGFAIAYLILKQLAKHNLTRIPASRVFDAMLLLVFGVILGGRTGYILLYDPELLTQTLDTFPYWAPFALNRGGMASHGGMIGVGLASLLIARGFRTESNQRLGSCSPLHVFDMLPLIATPGLALGRIANFINGELLGKIIAQPGTPAPWYAVKYPQELADPGHWPNWTQAQLAQLDDLSYRACSIENITNAKFLANQEARFAVLADHARTFQPQLEPLISARHPSQLYQAVAEGLVVGIICWLVFAKPRKPGTIAATFLIAYGTLRIATEFIRLPDAHLTHERIAGLSRGQWLSALMTLAGIAMLTWISRRNTPREPGWRTSTA